jgi:dipeptide transport system ATP-binding protein
MALLEIEDLAVEFPTSRGLLHAVEGVSLSVDQGEVLGIVGESGSGKSVTMLALMGLVAYPGRIRARRLAFEGRDLLALSDAERRKLTGKEVAMIFQEPTTSLNPCFTVGFQLAETLHLHEGLDGAALKRRCVELLDQVGIPAPESRLRSFPHQLSGGMNQRVMIAMAIACNPRLLIADEPTTALDVTIQAQILDLLRELNADFGAAIILISHDLGVVANVCRRVVVMYAGEVVEEGLTEDVLADPKHPYTWALINAVPRLDRYEPGSKRLTTIEGAPPDPARKPDGCPFHPRCRFRLDRCWSEMPPMSPFEGEREAACWYASEVGDVA